MANLQADIRCGCAHGFRGLGSMLQRVNAHFFASTLPAHYATLFFGQYDDRTRRLDYINCGQQPAIIRSGDRSMERLETTALPLGMASGWTSEKKTVQLRRGDSLFLCSDGVIEAGLESGDEFGKEGLISVERKPGTPFQDPPNYAGEVLGAALAEPFLSAFSFFGSVRPIGLNHDGGRPLLGVRL
jgi:sigma-B regulation protein RsbU (phosphoserine phosphatase)